MHLCSKAQGLSLYNRVTGYNRNQYRFKLRPLKFHPPVFTSHISTFTVLFAKCFPSQNTVQLSDE